MERSGVEVAIPLGVAFGNPGLLSEIGLGNVLAGLGSEAAYANDEQIDNQLRSVLFQVPGPEVENPLDCLDGTEIAACFTGVNDLGALDVMRSYDHGMPSYNDLREAYGLPRAESFTDITGETSEEFPVDPATDATNPIDDPNILDFVFLADADGDELDVGSHEAETATVIAIRRTTTAARLKAIFGDVDTIDAFTGMVSEDHVDGTEFGELQLAMWTRQFTALRDGDRFFYGNDSVLDDIATQYGIDYRRSLAEVIAMNTTIAGDALGPDAFAVGAAVGAAVEVDVNVDHTATTADDDAAKNSESGNGDRREDRSRERRRDRVRPPARRVPVGVTTTSDAGSRIGVDHPVDRRPTQVVTTGDPGGRTGHQYRGGSE